MGETGNFWSRVERRSDDECWTWRGGISRQGYGKFGGRLAHRDSYMKLVGPIPQGLQLDHLCRNRACVNPKHLEPVTNAVNCQRAVRDRVGDICKNGHRFSATSALDVNGYRRCRKCESERSKAYRSRKARP